MSSSLLLRNPSGEVIGYALAGGGQLCIRVNGNGALGSAHLGNGERERCVPVTCSGREQTFEWEEEGKLEWILIKQEGESIALGGNVPQLAFSKLVQHAYKNENACKNTASQNKSIQGDPRPIKKGEQRRWPPPPCWETACYLSGDWREAED